MNSLDFILFSIRLPVYQLSINNDNYKCNSEQCTYQKLIHTVRRTVRRTVPMNCT